jgi:autotransporter-associated beta strand protein
VIGTGAGGVTKSGAGTWTLSGANSYTGTTTINAGALSIGTNANLGSTTVGQAPVTLNGGAITTTAGITNTHAFTIGANGGTINVPINAQYFFNTANTLLGTGQLTVTGNGALAAGFGNLRLAQTSSYSGNMVLQSGGVVEYGVSGAVGAGATFTLGNQGEVSLSAGSAISLPNAVTVNGGTNSVLSFGNGTLGNYTGAITLNGNLTVALRDWFNYATVRSGTISGSISGVGGLTVNSGTGAGGTLTLSGTNTYAGNTAVTSSILAVTKAAALPGYDTPGRVSIGAGATLRVNVGGTNEFAGTDLDAIVVGVSFAPGSTFAIDTTNAAAPVVATANLTAAGLGLNKLGAGVLALNGAHTYTGSTTVSAGTLNLAGSINSDTSGGVVVGNTAASKAILSIASGSTLSANNLALGTNATGPGGVYQSGGSVTLNQAAGIGNLPIGAVAGGYGYYSLSGGTLAFN